MKKEEFKQELNEIHASEELIKRTIRKIENIQNMNNESNSEKIEDIQNIKDGKNYEKTDAIETKQKVNKTINIRRIVAGTITVITLSIGSVAAYIGVTRQYRNIE